MATDARGSLADAIRDLSEWTPEWERLQTFPVRYRSTEEEYLALDSNRFLEFADGFIEVLPMPTTYHQRISGLPPRFRRIIAGTTREFLALLGARNPKGQVS